MARERTSKRIVFTTVGSLGDVHPYLAIALGLRARGHEAIVATGACYRRKVEGLGLGFHPLRPDTDFLRDPEAMLPLMDLRRGTMRVLRDVILPVLRESYADTLAAAEGADLLAAHPLTYATRLVAEQKRIPWASTMTTPAGLFSAFDPPLLPGYPGISRCLRWLGPAFWDHLARILKRATRSWAEPWYRLRAEIGLPPATEANPLVDGHSPALHLALFSKRLAGQQPDWPPSTVVTGFPFHDRDGQQGLPPALARFLDDGPPPIVFTLGSSSAAVAGLFFEQSVAAAQSVGRKAVLVLNDNRNQPASLPAGVTACEYAPFSELFPRAAAVVHHGGIGTTGLAMRAGRAMLVVPYAHDQPDNAERLRRLGIAQVIPRPKYTASRAALALRRLLDDPAYARRAAAVGDQIRLENGVASACDSLERLLS
jgi:UDP:flavonoid glycosyltransferase YjiC (YdhE family)